MLHKTKLVFLGVLSAILLGCGGGSGGSSGGGVAPQYTIGGNVTGLTNFKSLTLKNNGVDDLVISADGSFNFTTAITSNAAYLVTVSTQPLGMQCSVLNGTGIASANVTNIAVSCISRAGKYAYVTNTYSGTVSAFSIDNSTGNLSPISGSPFTTTAHPTSVAAHPSGKFLFVADMDVTTPLSAFTIDGSTGALGLIATYDYGGGSYSVAVDPQGKFVFIADADGYIESFSINQTTGALTFVGAYTAGTTPVAVTIDPSSKYVYVLNQGSNNISAYSIDSSTGALTSIANYVAGFGFSLAVDPSGKFLYSASVRNGKNVQAYSINSGTGALASIGGYGDGTSNDYVVINPTGQFLYNVLASSVVAYSRNQDTGALALIGTYATGGSGANAMAIDPLNKYAYIPNKGSNYIGDVSFMTINQTSGALSGNSPIASRNYNTSVAIAVGQ